MISGRPIYLLPAAIAWMLTAGGVFADPLPGATAAPSAPDAATAADKAPQPPSVMDKQDVPSPAAAPPADTAAATPLRNTEPVAPSQAFAVLGKKVHGPDGKDAIGSIIDILVDDQGRPRAAIVDFGGFLGVGSRKIAVDWQLMKFHPTDTAAQVILDLDRAQIQAAPEYKDPTQPAEVVEPSLVGGGGPPPIPGAVASPASPVPDATAQPDAEKHSN
jgi:hypothetical protein